VGCTAPTAQGLPHIARHVTQRKLKFIPFQIFPATSRKAFRSLGPGRYCPPRHATPIEVSTLVS
jgi:hypothetical protein